VAAVVILIACADGATPTLLENVSTAGLRVTVEVVEEFTASVTDTGTMLMPSVTLMLPG
jgi:hypothetical protein